MSEVAVTQRPTGSRRVFRSDSAADRFMRRVFGVKDVDNRCGEGAHRAFRTSVLVSAIRCLITYLVIPVLATVLSLGRWLAAPVGLALCVIAVANGIVSMRRFWRADHPWRWLYTAFMAVVFAILAVALVADLKSVGVIA